MTDRDPLVSALEQWIEVFMRRSMRNFIQYARESGLSMSQLGALLHINRMGTSGVTNLGDHLGVTSAAASQMLERLVQQGLILRSEDPHDRRVKQVVLTEEGCRMLEESIRARQSWLGDLANVFSESEKEPVITALNLLIDRAVQLEQTNEPET
jgi:DNA-binding MarR family transcriptional regulator